MLISIVTATYNNAQTLLDCVKSINDQTFQDIEHIIIDGASKDNTMELLRSVPNLRSIIRSEPDLGIYDALNKGISMAKGDVIGFLHSDDLFGSNDTLFNIMNTFRETGADLVYGDLVYVDKKNINKVRRYWKSKTFKPVLIRSGWMPPHTTVFMKKEIYNKHGFFNLSFKIAADYEYMLRIFNDKDIKFAYLPEIITKMRAGGMSNRRIPDIFRKSAEDYKALRKNRIRFPLYAVLMKNISKLSQFV
jgi:glycosyltransferase